MTNDLQAARERWSKNLYHYNMKRIMRHQDSEDLADAYAADEIERLEMLLGVRQRKQRPPKPTPPPPPPKK